ncbi:MULTISPECIES: HAD family hydrolase [Photobacterium]|uniref:HAD family hydrolase n=1 Tax=Photobacterium ganghwense TaxID=320778 RepID=A0A0J1H850_9GAMM|nr:MULTISPECIES: HAD family phosphatase [Photobacterium]KLV07851.1 HAD family hydrolase [Photobacterium ganghwense]MBV1843228.1 HAD family phosphatase [Photobacterium ganghwense]PSU06943.1 HAD family phosphatase [Photobacterium ganghwense]QSV15695.1 HAD family phosphatase [Photobacterium ganghwense]
MIRNVIFDFGAVLFEWNPRKIVATFTDDTDEQERLLNHVIHHPDWLALDRGTMLMAEAQHKFASRSGLDESRIEDFIEHIQTSLTLIDESYQLVQQVITMGFNAYFLTNMCSAFFEKLNEKHGLYALFDGGLVSGKELLIKPEPEIFELLVQRFNLEPSESLFIDDHPANLTSASQLGFQVYQFKNPSESCAEIRNLLKIN